MHMKRPIWLAVILAPVLVAAQTGNHDGNWTTTMACEASNRMPAYRWTFVSAIANGNLHGQHGEEGGPGYLVIDGPVNNNGSAKLDTDPQNQPDRRGGNPHAGADRDADAGSHHRADRNATTDWHADAHPRQPDRRARQRAKSSLLPFSGVIDERCSSMSTDGACPVSMTTAIRSERRSPPMRTQSRRKVNAIGRTRFSNT